MAYIRNGQVVERPTGVIAMLRGFIAAVISFVMLFVQSMINPEAAVNAKKESERRGPGGPGGSGGSGGGPRGPRITGLDRITGGNHAAQCNSGG